MWGKSQINSNYTYSAVNASQAGAGNLEIIVSVNGCNVPNYVQSEGNAKFKVNFKPREAAPHNLSVRFNGEPVPGKCTTRFRNPENGKRVTTCFFLSGLFIGSPFICKILKSDQLLANEDGLKMCHVNKPATVSVECPHDSSTCKVTVASPSGRMLPVELGAKVENRIAAKFTPVEVGKCKF